jgi:hypothetical protein
MDQAHTVHRFRHDKVFRPTETEKHWNTYLCMQASIPED